MAYSKEEFAEALEDYKNFVQGSYPPAKAQARLLKFYGDPELVKAVADEHERQLRGYVTFREPHGVTEGTVRSWYDPHSPNAWCWPGYRTLLQAKGWQTSSIDALDGATTKIISHLPHPGEGQIRTRGLIVGYVQSGKTANYTGLIAKAADAGYKLFIVLAGMTSSLRRQTQTRLSRELCAPNTDYWNTLTSVTRDFHESGNPDFLLSPKHPFARILCVVKKNVHILERLKNFFASANVDVKRNCPVLIIDDEADQASVNTKKKAQGRSAINRKIVELLAALPKSAYIGYTATPFANVFIDPSVPEDLYPRDFIFDLPRPRQYFGAERIFGRDLTHYEEGESHDDGLDIVRLVPEEDAEKLAPAGPKERFQFEPEMTNTLSDALRYFILATAARLARGQDAHTSMLIHTTLYTHTHTQLQNLVDEYLGSLQHRWTEIDEGLREEFAALWTGEAGRVTSADLQVMIDEVDFDAVEPFVAAVFNRLRVVVDNGYGEGLSYSDDHAEFQIAIGGNTLSRGLTLEGLIVSYFLRPAAAYDTLLQMGRWFGHRAGYEDLPRVWMTTELRENFFHLATVEEEIRHDIRRYEREGQTPRDFAIRVQTHPKLIITSQLKMQNVELTSASYDNAHIQTFRFYADDTDWLQANLRATQRLITTISNAGVPEEVAPGRWLFASVDAEPVITFLAEYQSLHDDFRPELLCGYIQAEQAAGALTTWNVAVIGNPKLGRIDLGGPQPFHLVRRTRLKDYDPANIKALTGRSDRTIDLQVDHPSVTQDVIEALRNSQLPGVGLLLIYPIARDSEPNDPDGRRTALGASEHVIGVALSFPASRRDQADYVRNNLQNVFSGDSLAEDIRGEEDAPDHQVDDLEEVEG